MSSKSVKSTDALSAVSDPSASRLAQLATRFVDSGLYLRNWSKRTASLYRVAFNGLGSVVADVPTKTDLEAWVLSLRKRGLTPGGVNVYVRAVNSFLTWLHEEGETPTRLRVKLLKAPLVQPRLLSPTDLKRLALYVPSGSNAKRSHLLVLLLLDTGLRVQEALDIRREAVDLDNCLIRVMGKGSKERVVAFSLPFRKHLFRHVAHNRNGLLFATRTGLPLSYRNAYRDVRVLCERAGVETAVHPHLLRHQFAANFIARGGDIFYLSRLLGHTTISTTQIYLRALGVEAMSKSRSHLSPLS